MITTQELMQGNLISHEGILATVNEIHKNNIDVDYLEGGTAFCSLKNVEPVPLTEEWLLKFGFEEDFHQAGTEFIKEGTKFSVYYHPEFESLVESPFSRNFGGCDVYFKFVHQLQNLYFSLTKEKLQPQHQHTNP